LRDFRLFFENGGGPPLKRAPVGDVRLPDVSRPFLEVILPSSCFVFTFSDLFAFLNTRSSFTGIFSADVGAKSALVLLSVCRSFAFSRSLLGVWAVFRSICDVCSQPNVMCRVNQIFAKNSFRPYLQLLYYELEHVYKSNGVMQKSLVTRKP